MELWAGGEHVASPRLVLEEGAKAGVRIDTLFVDVIAKDAPELNGIRLSFAVGTVEGGRAQAPFATPSIVAAAGQRAEVRVTPETNNPAVNPLTLAVIAQRQRR
jgi:hypothetical protein